jgi:hypothetical protein
VYCLSGLGGSLCHESSAWEFSMRRAPTFIAALALFSFAVWANSARAEMGPCVPAVFDLICGNGNGAARVIVKTISPSKRLAFAWRLAKRPPGAIPEANADDLENFVIAIADGTVLAKSHGAYWDLGTKIAKAYLMTAWSPDSRLLVKVEQRAESVSAEVFSFAENDAAVGPVDFASVIKAALQEKDGAANPGGSSLVFTAIPAITMDDRGAFRATVHLRRKEDAVDGPTYDVIVQATRAPDTINVNVVSITPHEGTAISIIVH